MSIQVYDYQQLDVMSRRPSGLQLENRNRNRLYLSWRNSQDNQCKMIGPETKCFCNHRFKDHQYLNPVNGKTHCKDKGCKCNAFQYVPTHGSYDFKCLCKHSYKQHDRNSKMCQKEKCSHCVGFNSSWTCSCGQKYDKHQTISQTLDERKRQGKQLNDMNRIINQLQANVKQGGLCRPVKQDREQKLKRYSQNVHQNISTNKNIQIRPSQQDDIQEIDFKKYISQKNI